MSGRALRKVRELPIELWCGGGGGGRCGMLAGSERCSGVGGMVGFMRVVVRLGLSCYTMDQEIDSQPWVVLSLGIRFQIIIVRMVRLADNFCATLSTIIAYLTCAACCRRGLRNGPDCPVSGGLCKTR